jgi:hypothetical protein
MIHDDSIEPHPSGNQDTQPTPAPAHRDPEYPHIPYPIIRPARGSPYFIHPRFGTKACLFPPGTPPLTSEDVRRELEDFP